MNKNNIQPTRRWRKRLLITKVVGAPIAVVIVAGIATWAVGCVVETIQPAVASGAHELPRESASQEFWEEWSDNQGEVNAYRLVTPRYGELREGTSILVYVLEESDSRTWIKDDQGDVPEENRTIVLKLNEVMSFRTGIYPYRVMTSVFAPVNGIGRERFSPTRIIFTSQEWCGQVYHRVMPEIDRFTSEMRSYFSVEGEETDVVQTEPLALYENGLMIQLRELDGAFANGGDWSGQLIPALWNRRRSHEPLEPIAAAIARSEAQLSDGTPINRFVLRYGEYERTFDVEREGARRILGWRTSEGEEAELLGTARLPYWQLHSLGDERFLEQIGLNREGKPLRDSEELMDEQPGS